MISRAINKISIRYTFLIPIIENLMDCLSDSMYFSKIYLKSSWYQIMIKLEDEWEITLKLMESFTND